ncbi:MAG: hypothetical protein SGBAC_011180, partial [Bacillariaceae sp.]
MPPIPKDVEVEDNSYMALRAAKIARNEAQLKKLGLVKTISPSPIAMGSNVKRSKRPIPKRRPLPPPAMLRRSNRISNKPDYKEKALPRDRTATLQSLPDPVMVTKNNKNIRNNNKRRRTTTASPTTARAAPAPPAANSVRSIDLNIEQLILGNNDDGGGLLGQQMEQTGKEFVIYQTFDKAASPEDKDRLQETRLSFNKYCGVQEWRNAMFLWVNLGNKDNPVVNDFLNDSKQITWFGGSRMHDESPVILKLIKMGQETATKAPEAATKAPASTSNNTKSNIVLWCRKYQVETKQFTPYVCFGRLGYKSHEP